MVSTLTEAPPPLVPWAAPLSGEAMYAFLLKVSPLSGYETVVGWWFSHFSQRWTCVVCGGTSVDPH